MNEKEYKCRKCGKLFSENEIVREPIYEMGENTVITNYMSPCCFASYTDEW